MNFIVKCNGCDFEMDVKYQSRFEKIKIDTYLCKICITNNKIRTCPRCNRAIVYQSPAAKKKAIELNSICKNCCSNQIPQSLTELQKNFLDGLLLGDASIVYAVKNKSIFPRLTLSRKEEDKDYLFWQYETFKDFYGTGPTAKKCFDKRTEKEYYQYHLQTKSGIIFAEYHKRWYPSGVKIIPKELKITPLLLLVWFLDDGCIVNSSKNGLTLKLSTNGFSKDDVLFLAKLLDHYFNDTFNVYKNGSGFIIKASTLPTIKFIKKIDAVFPECMQRKRTWNNFDFEYVNNSNYFG